MKNWEKIWEQKFRSEILKLLLAFSVMISFIYHVLMKLLIMFSQNPKD